MTLIHSNSSFPDQLSRIHCLMIFQEHDVSSRKSFFVNPEKKEGGSDSNRQQRITGYFIPKVGVAT